MSNIDIADFLYLLLERLKRTKIFNSATNIINYFRINVLSEFFSEFFSYQKKNLKYQQFHCWHKTKREDLNQKLRDD